MSAPISYPPDDTQPQAIVLRFPKPGDVVNVAIDESVRPVPMMVYRPCDQRHVYYCVEHAQNLFNGHQVAAHVESGDAHTLVRICRVHGRPEALGDSERSELATYQQLESGL